MAGELVLITGGTGHVGFRVIIDALTAGYHVRAAVRSFTKGQQILDTLSKKKLTNGSNVELVEVPDMLAPGAYDEVIKGVRYAIHIASPLSFTHKEGDDWNKTLIDPAVKGTLNILKAAKNSGDVKRVVITSSCIAIIPFADLASGSSTTVFNESSRTSFSPPPYTNSLEGYSASKVAALNEAEAWVTREKPFFDVVHLFPAFIIGPNELVTKKLDAFSGTNSCVLGPVTGTSIGSLFNASIHLYDVSLAHVKALDPKVPGNRGYILSSGSHRGTQWEDMKDVVATEFEPEVKMGVLKNDGVVATISSKVDASKSEDALGMRYKSFKDQVKDVVGWYLALADV